MQDALLYFTAMPVLLGDPKEAGQIAALLYRRHGITCRWVGNGSSMKLRIYARRYPLHLPPNEEGERLYLRRLLDMAKEEPAWGIPCIIPCSPDAELFLTKFREELEEHFTLLPHPQGKADPLYSLVHHV